MDNIKNAFVRTTNLYLILFWIAISFIPFCKCNVGTLQTTPQAIATQQPKRCSFTNVDYDVGENWYPFLLPKGYYRCIRCSCKLASDGSKAIVDCKACRKTTANGQHPDEGQKSCTYHNKTRQHGTVWAVAAMESHSLHDDQCTECSCIDGFVTCAIKTCPALSCRQKQNVSETCCPICKDVQGTRNPLGCETMGRYYNHLETWSPRIPPRYDLCHSCSCKNTTVSCRRIDCPNITCERPERKLGACCDSCPDVQGTRDPMVVHTPSGCEWGKRRFPHNYNFHPTIGPFGVSYCVKCVCNASKIECSRIHCPTNYLCESPVTVTGKCCKVCTGSESKVTVAPNTPASNGRKPCPIGRYWRVHEYRGQSRNSTYIRVQFALEDRERNFVEIHTIAANRTFKIVKVINTTTGYFDDFKENSTMYFYIGKIREVQRVKMKSNEKRPCHSTQGCVHTVLKIMDRFRTRVGRCNTVTSGTPDAPIEKETPRDE